MVKLGPNFHRCISIAILAIVAGSSLAADEAAPSRVDAEAREYLRQQILARKGIDATRCGEDIANPFTSITEAGQHKLRAARVDPARLRKLRAVLLSGKQIEANPKTFVNRDSDTILVLAKGFVAGAIYSMGPVLVVDGARPGKLLGADLVWFVDETNPPFTTRGYPYLTTPADDFGWRRPDDFLKLVRRKPGVGPQVLALVDPEKKKKDLRDRVLAGEGEDVAEWGDPVANPFTCLSREGRDKLTVLGIDTRRLRKLKAILLSGDYLVVRNFINRDPDTILILGTDLSSGGSIYSLGPSLVVGNAHVGGQVIGAELVWFLDQASPYRSPMGRPVILPPSALRSWVYRDHDDFWFGEYGWNTPPDFLKRLPIKLTSKQFDALWDDLRAADADRITRAIRWLVAGADDSIPDLRRRLRLPPRPAEDRLDQLIDDLDNTQLPKREAASRELRRLGLLVEPELLLVLQTKLSIEVRRRVEQILDGVKSEKKRIHRAFAVLEQMESPQARRLLKDLAEGDADLFLTREAKAALERRDRSGKP